MNLLWTVQLTNLSIPRFICQYVLFVPQIYMKIGEGLYLHLAYLFSCQVTIPCNWRFVSLSTTMPLMASTPTAKNIPPDCKKSYIPTETAFASHCMNIVGLRDSLHLFYFVWNFTSILSMTFVRWLVLVGG